MTTDLNQATQPGAGPALDPALLRAIGPSATRMAADEATFVRLLHEDIGTFVRHLPDGGWQFCERIARTVLWLTLSEQPADVAVQSVLWLGAANQADGFPLPEYVTVGHALVRIAREMCDTDWSTTTGSAWIRFFIWLRPHLQAGATQRLPRAKPTRPQPVQPQPAPQEPAGQRPAADDDAASEDMDVLAGDQVGRDLLDS